MAGCWFFRNFAEKQAVPGKAQARAFASVCCSRADNGDAMKQINWGFIGCGEVTEKKTGRDEVLDYIEGVIRDVSNPKTT